MGGFEVIPLVNLDKFCDFPLPHFFAHILPIDVTMIFLQYNEAAMVQSLDLCDPDI